MLSSVLLQVRFLARKSGGIVEKRWRRRLGVCVGSLARILRQGDVTSHATPLTADRAGPTCSRSRTGAHCCKEGSAKHGWIESLIAHMTLEEKVGQLFVTYAYGETADTTTPGDVAKNQRDLGVDNGAELVEKYHVGGIIYFAWSGNVNNPQQIAGLSNGLQSVAMRQRLPIPLLITTDQEQGVVVRVTAPATQFPGNMALGATRSVDSAATAARITGQELRALGINQNYGPVADVNVNARNPVIGVRSFSEDASLVSDIVAAQVHGFQQEANVAATAKHFPGSW